MSYAALAALVAVLRYKTGWRFHLEHGFTSAAWTCATAEVMPEMPATVGAVTWAAYEPARLIVCVLAEDSTRPGMRVVVQHTFAVPDDPGVPWHRWLLECIAKVETHEMCEAFAVGEHRPFFPPHGPDAGPGMYEIRDRGLP